MFQLGSFFFFPFKKKKWLEKFHAANIYQKTQKYEKKKYTLIINIVRTEKYQSVRETSILLYISR